MLDLHCHLLPGVDDGASDWDMALAMAQVLEESGYRQVACSPHYGEGPGGDVPVERASEVRSQLQERLDVAGIGVRLLPNAEHHLTPELFDRIERKEVVPIGGEGRWMLVELPWNEIPNVQDILFRIQLKGFRVLLAHPERYRYLGLDAIESLVDRGVRMQLELGSFIKLYGRASYKRARSIADRGLGHVLATDLHRPDGAARWIPQAMQEVDKRYGEGAVERGAAQNPQSMVEDAEPSDIEPFAVGRG